MKIKCCNCKKEYDLGDNIFGYDKANQPILICPHCGFKHIINFMPFEKKIKAKKINKLDLGGGPYYVVLGASRIASATRVDISDGDDVDVKDGTAWDVSTIVYASIYKDLTDAFPACSTFKPDGAKMYIINGNLKRVCQYTLSTAWDVSTASYDSKYKNIFSEQNYPDSVVFSSDGTKMYIVGTDPETVHQYTLSTAWDVSTASYASKYKDVSAQDGNPYDLAFSSDGFKMYIAGYATSKIYQYTLSTAWDVSTASYASKYKNVSSEGGYPRGIYFKSDGLKMYFVGYDDTVYQYTLTTAWDVSTAIYDSKLKNIFSEENAPRDVAFSSDGTKMYIVGTQYDTVYQYTLSTAWTKTNDFILAIRIYGSKGPYARAYKLRWKISGGTFADVAATGAISFSAVTDLVDGNDLLTGEKLCDVQTDYTWQNGLENEGDNLLPDSGTYSLADEYYTEFQWALDCNGATDEATYEFELWDATEGVSIGTCLASITMAAAAAGFKWNTKTILKWCGKVISKWNIKVGG